MTHVATRYLRGWIGTVTLLAAGVAAAFPPALPHLIYGSLRNERGEAVRDASTEIVLETTAGVKLLAGLIEGREPGVNFALKIPMDAGLMGEPYRPTALRPTVPFRLTVKIRGVSYVPIEMKARYATLGLPGQRTRLDLTLGEDTDGDGLPDAWERQIGSDITQVGPNDDADRDGMSNRDEYLAGTYAFDPQHSFALEIAGLLDGAARLRFTAIRGRSYSVEGSADLKTWSEAAFRVAGGDGRVQSAYAATEFRPVEVVVAPADGEAMPEFFRLVVH